MPLPPGIPYLWHILPSFVFPSALTYIFFQLLHAIRPTFVVSRWIIVPLVVLSRPLLFVFGFYHTKRASKRRAAAAGAVVPPIVQDSSVAVVSEMASSTKTGYPGDMMNQLSKTYGKTFQLELFQRTLIVTFEPEHIKAILSTQFDDFEKGSVFINQMDSLLGTGVFNADGEMWKFHRSMTRPFFTRERISDFEIYQRNCDTALRAAKTRLNEGFAVDFQDLVSRFTLDSASEFLFGHMVGSLNAGIPYPPSHADLNSSSFYAHPSTEFVKAFSEGQMKSVSRLGYGPEWALLEFGKDSVKPLRKVIDNFTQPLMVEALRRREQELKGEVDSKNEEDGNLLAHLVRHTQDPKVLQDELMNLLVAGRDTTGSLLTSSVYMLTQHPNVVKRLRDEIFEKVGPTGSPTYEQMREMKYMRAFLNEILRLYPPVPANTRTSNKDVVLPPGRNGQDPIYVPANTPVFYITIHMQRREDLWGPDAMEFDPDRFLDDRLRKYLVPNPFIFCPFNGGPRICLGQQFAYHEATFFLVRLLQQFTNFTLDDSVNAKPPAAWAEATDRKAKEKVHLLSHLTMFVKGGLWIHMGELKTQA
ncbi:cytochrome P450 [Pholiota conissans]|uniref:Cytochrome P450 n=1 Tax=Pholiota conissans TaxID=109636 RepID=A0A9P5YWK5_9AGAR|nr:cytochrome P450 [Pholiota conissans]